MSVGDVNSSERGSGARFNDGKADIGLIPLRLLAEYCDDGSGDGDKSRYLLALRMLGKFQETGDHRVLYTALGAIDFDWRDCARVFEYGKAKYAAWNWAKGMAWSIPLACAARHLMAVLDGDQYLDVESGLPHDGHFACNIFMLLYYKDNYPEGNDLMYKTVMKAISADVPHVPV
jgi:hypothetical protein